MVAETADILARLVGFPTISAASNLSLLDYVEEEVTRFGARVRRFPNAEGDKANLLVSVGPDEPGGIVLSGHTDVVPTDGQIWTGNPFELRRQNDRLIGRGATDMKGFLACCLAALPTISAQGLRRPVHFAFSYDEEVGCTGVGPMAEWIGSSALAPKFAVIGEPSSMEFVSAHKGGLIGWATVKGKPGHSSQPDRYVNAVMVASQLVAFIETLRVGMRDGPFFEGLDPPYSTIQVNQIAGGSHGNIVAETCRFFWEMRIIPGQSPDAVFDTIKRYAHDVLEPAMHRVDPGTGIMFEVQASIPALAPNDDTDLERDILALLGKSQTLRVPYGSEAGIFQQAGIPSMIIGPGDIADAHQPDESIGVLELSDCVEFLTRLTRTYC
ncbi:acetylornithine deacetylase [Microvirga antarctica]|uniref:acetylornithine deacetylase n=1 Tax=Microvirga antarctica TaxID=2819233 RepID=UPI001B30F57D|nr:acetylornithine deacetylase [Microvirga antarctica]